MRYALLFALWLPACAAEQPLTGSVSAVAAPMPVMFGPVRCIGSCATEPAAKHAYDINETSSELAEKTKSSDTSTSTNTSGQMTTTTTTRQVESRNAEVIFAAPLMKPLLVRPFSPREVAQLDSLRMGRAAELNGAGTSHRTDTTTLLVAGVGYSYVLPPLSPTSPTPSASPTGATVSHPSEPASKP